jgi:hypothetical protein
MRDCEQNEKRILYNDIFMQTHFKPKVYQEPMSEQYLRNLPCKQYDRARSYVTDFR